jgi:undecaprenyl diphosphate synthase
MYLNKTDKKISSTKLGENTDPKKDEEIRKCLLDAGNLPQHIAIIMDGDRRWAVERNLPKTDGHRYGRESVRDVVRACGQLDIKVLTLYTFSTENWSRPKTEVKTLMSWLRDSLLNEIGELHQNNVRLNAIGRVDGLPSAVKFALNSALEKTKKNTGLTLNLALNYGGRTELVDAFRRLAEKIV